jgi:sugar phosphate isomerase/epimerase
MELGISTWSLPWACGVAGFPAGENRITPEYLIELAARWKLGRVQLADNIPWHILTKDQLVELAQIAEERGIILEAGMRGWQTQEIDVFLDLCAVIRSPFLRIVMIPSDKNEPLPTLGQKRESLKALIPRLLEENRIAAIENHDHFKAADLADLIEDLNTQAGRECFGVCLDTVNSLGCLEDPNRVLRSLAPHTINLHLKDFIIRRVSHSMGFEVTGTAPGEGMTDIKHVLKTLAPYKKCQSAVIEQWVPFQNTVQDSVELEKKWLEEGIPEIKKYM